MVVANRRGLSQGKRVFPLAEHSVGRSVGCSPIIGKAFLRVVDSLCAPVELDTGALQADSLLDIILLSLF